MQSQWPQIEWTAVQKIIDSMPAVILKFPLWVAFLIVGGIIYIPGFVGTSILDYTTYITRKAK